MAAYGERTLVIDARNAVYLSDDSGRHWKPVAAVWQGRAVKAVLVSPAAVSGQDAGPSPNGNIALFATRGASLKKSLSAELAGTVTDRSGAVIPGATVVVTDAATNIRRTAKTDSNGRYHADGLMAGIHTVEAYAPGFLTQRTTGVTVDVSGPTVTNLTLSVATASETVTVGGTEQKSAAVRFPSGTSSPGLKAILQAPPVFEITTDTGDHWTSVDGLTWKHN
jgi:hypothetical protein